MAEIRVHSPEDVFIHSITTERHVSSGETLVELWSPALEKAGSMLQAMQEHISIIERPFNDGRLDREIGALGDKVAALQSAAERTAEIEAWIAGAVEMGTLPKRDLNEAMAHSFQAKAAYIDASVAMSNAERNKIDLLDKLTSARNELARETEFLAAIRSALKIKSPDEGSWQAFGAVGSFFKKGQLIGTLSR